MAVGDQVSFALSAIRTAAKSQATFVGRVRLYLQQLGVLVTELVNILSTIPYGLRALIAVQVGGATEPPTRI
jgi:hypothetical protein